MKRSIRKELETRDVIPKQDVTPIEPVIPIEPPADPVVVEPAAPIFTSLDPRDLRILVSAILAAGHYASNHYPNHTTIMEQADRLIEAFQDLDDKKNAP